MRNFTFMPGFNVNRAKSVIIWWLIASAVFGITMLGLFPATDRVHDTGVPASIMLILQIPLGLLGFYSGVGLVALPVLFVLAFGPSIWEMSNPPD